MVKTVSQYQRGGGFAAAVFSHFNGTTAIEPTKHFAFANI
jgi:hypothetical protein